MKRKQTKRFGKIRFNKGDAKSSYMVIVGIAFLFAILLVGFGNRPTKNFGPRNNNASGTPSSFTCCDTGDGDACQARTDVTVTYQNATYGLLKSNFLLFEKDDHIKWTTAQDGSRILINTGDDERDPDGEKRGCPNSSDWVVDRFPDGTWKCIPIPDEQIIYKCRDDNPPGLCNEDIAKANLDAYWRMDGFPIPDGIRNCTKPTGAPGVEIAAQQTIIPNTPEPSGRDNLQLETFTVVNNSTSSAIMGWISPFCKPAVYLYPEQTMPVNVQVHPVGKMTLTIPKYPLEGWNVLAMPDGQLVYRNSYFDYLYYEAEIPDEKIVVPDEGFVASYNDLDKTLAEILQKLGLQTNEANDFREYWVKVLPKAPYYKLSVVPQSNLDSLAPLTINPQPKTVLRVAIYFEALEEPVALVEPSLTTIRRNGFTVVEWGGFFKRDPNRPFSCFM